MRKIWVAVIVAMLCMAPLSLQWTSSGPSLTMVEAQARIGRPLFPGSVAGVNRRVHRRAYRHAAYGAAAYGAYRASYAYYGYTGYRRNCTCY